MKIKLTQGKCAIVDGCDYTYLNQFKWHYVNKGYAQRTIGKHPNRRTIRMHRVILERMGYQDFAESDHINENGLDNRRCNLRPATASQNRCNRGLTKHNTSGYKGVSWDRKKWHTKIMVNGKPIHLGLFDDIKDAARAYNEAVIKYHGEFAVLNEV